jgi:glycolate oxidase iron-sulfur subunit
MSLAPDHLRDESRAEIRRCVHCGFCTATCPTYVLLGDERDSPRGRIELIKAMLASDSPPTKAAVTHIDRCLSCLSCVSTCPSGVDYGKLIDHARAHVEATYRRPWPERLLRAAIPAVLTRPWRLSLALVLARLAQPLDGMLPAQLKAMRRLAPAKAGRRARPGVVLAQGGRKGRVALLQGCVEPALASHVREAAVRLLTRAGFEVVFAEGEGCCGAVSEHLGRADEARGFARANVAAWAKAGELTAIVTTAAGCGTMLKAYGEKLGPEGAPVAARARDILEFLAEVGLPPVAKPPGISVAYHAACSLQHGQQVKAAPPALLAQAGFDVRPVPEGHLCCGSAGTYNILQPELASRLRDRKAANIARTGAEVLAAGNVGCMAQLAPALQVPVVHPVELLDWATGGPRPAALTPEAPFRPRAAVVQSD